MFLSPDTLTTTKSVQDHPGQHVKRFISGDAKNKKKEEKEGEVPVVITFVLRKKDYLLIKMSEELFGMTFQKISAKKLLPLVLCCLRLKFELRCRHFTVQHDIS